MISPRAFKQSCSPLVALQHSVICLAFHCLVWELERGEERSFSRLETETQGSVLSTLLWSSISSNLGRVSSGSLKKSCSPREDLQFCLLRRNQWTTGLGDIGCESWQFQLYFHDGIRLTVFEMPGIRGQPA